MITEPGIYEMSNEDYHADTDWLSSTRLKSYLPEHFKMTASQDALDFGTFFHVVVLEPDALGDYVVLDAAAIAGNNPKTGKPYGAPHMTARFKAAAAEAEADGKKVVTQAEWDKAHAMRDAAAAHPQAAELLFNRPGKAEVSAFWQADDGIRHKARFDRLIPGRIVDLKSTTAKPGADSLARAVLDFGYDLSVAHYLEVARGLDLDAEAFSLVFVAKEPPHYVTVAELDDAFLARGALLRERAIERWANPDVAAYEGAGDPLTLTPPGWARIAPIETAIPSDFTWSLNEYA